MSSLEQKLMQFNKIVLNTAEQKKEIIIREAKSKVDKMTLNAENESLEYAYNLIQGEILKLNREKSQKILSEQVKSKKELLLLREDMIKEIFEDVLNKVNNFIKSEDYKNFMKMLIKKGMEELGSNEGITINICSDDQKHIDFLNEQFPNNEISITSSDIMGGVILIWGNKLLDFSIKKFYQNEKDNFLAMSGLSIY